VSGRLFQIAIRFRFEFLTWIRSPIRTAFHSEFQRRTECSLEIQSPIPNGWRWLSEIQFEILFQELFQTQSKNQ